MSNAMRPEYLITKRTICPTCKGEKFVQHPAWAWYWRENAKSRTVEEDLAWFRNHGYDVNYYSELPSEEIECSDCDGAGYIENQVDLRAVLREITAEVQDDFARALEYAEQWRALTHTLRMENNLEITHFRQLVQYLEMKNERTEY